MGAWSKNMLLGINGGNPADQFVARASDVPPTGVAASRGWLTQDEMEADKSGTNGEEGLSAKEPTKSQYKNIAENRPGAEELTYWKPLHTVNEEEAKQIAERTGNHVKSVKEWLNENPGALDAPSSGTMPGATATTAATPKAESYEEMLKYFKAQAGMNADAEKRQRRNELFSSIGDGISALSSLYQTTQGAPVTYTHGDNMTSELRDRYDGLLKSRAASNEQYLNYLKAKRQMELDADTRWWREQQLSANQAYRDALLKDRKEGREETERHNKANEATNAKNADTAATNAETNKVKAESGRTNAEANKIRAEKAGSKSGTKKGRQKKTAPKRKARTNASKQAQSSSGNTAPAMRK